MIGDLPSISLVMIDGKVITGQTSNTLPAKRVALFANP